MTISINQISNGLGLRIDKDIYLVLEHQHVKPGKGSAFVRVRLKNVLTGQVVDRTFKTADKIDDIVLEERGLQYLYFTGDTYHFMDHTSFEEVAVSKEDLGDAAKFLLENLEVTGLCYNNKVLKIILPIFITAVITETEPGVRGDSSRAGTKPANIETGTTILVPLFIQLHDLIKIDTRSGEYVERVQK